MKHCLSLFRPTGEVAHPTVLLYLNDVPSDSLPTFNLTPVVPASSAHEISTIPLKPTAGGLPHKSIPSPSMPSMIERLCTKKFQLRIVVLRTELRIVKPVRWKLPAAIRHIFPTEHAKRHHFLWRDFWSKFRGEIFSHGLCQHIHVPALHLVADTYSSYYHERLLPLFSLRSNPVSLE